MELLTAELRGLIAHVLAPTNLWSPRVRTEELSPTEVHELPTVTQVPSLCRVVVDPYSASNPHMTVLSGPTNEVERWERENPGRNE